MKRKTLYNFNRPTVQLTFNQGVFNRIQYRTEHNMYSTRLDNSTDNSTDGLTIRLAIQLYNSALQFRLQFVLSIASVEFVLTVFFYIIFAVSLKQHGINIGIITSLKIANGYIR